MTDEQRASGLVYSSTSDTVTLTPELAHSRRMKRKKCGTITAARLLQEQMQERGFRYRVAMFTLTYADIDGYSPRHISQFMKTTREYLRRRGWRLRYVWVLELQRRGAPHYHVLIWLPRGVTLPKPDKSGSWPHGLTRSEFARNAVGYIAKYAAKSECRRDLPRGARVCGCGGLDERQGNERRWWLSPMWVRKHWSLGTRVYPARQGGGWVDRDTGEIVRSPWVVCFVCGRLSVVRI